MRPRPTLPGSRVKRRKVGDPRMEIWSRIKKKVYSSLHFFVRVYSPHDLVKLIGFQSSLFGHLIRLRFKFREFDKTSSRLSDEVA